MSEPARPDPLDVLRAAPDAVAPTIEFTARLRARIERALALPRGVTVSDLTTADPATAGPTTAGPTTAGPTLPDPTAPDPTAPVPDLRDDHAAVAGAPPALVPYLAVAGARAAIEYYGAVLGARVEGEPYVMADDRIGHAELALPGGARLMLSDEYPEIGVAAPAAGAGNSVTLHLTVRDVDATLERGVRLGGRLQRPAADYEYGRNGVLVDPFGHRWMIAGDRVEAEIRPGDFAYVSLWVPDAGRAARFFAAVLGWRFESGGGPDRRQVVGQSRHHGIVGRPARPDLFYCLAVDDLDAACERVTAAGGVAGPPAVEVHGRVADCVDDQGTRFALYESPAVSGQPRTEEASRHGDLAYVTIEVVDSARARRFYGEVMGWEFVPGRVADGWQVQGSSPMAGMSGGHDRATTLPMYAVDDVAAAVVAVRAAGGSATDPEVQPYGVTSLCSDDQGTRFYLGQLS